MLVRPKGGGGSDSNCYTSCAEMEPNNSSLKDKWLPSPKFLENALHKMHEEVNWQTACGHTEGRIPLVKKLANMRIKFFHVFI